MSNSPIFIGGAGRSGTTLLRVILDSHSAIACGQELKVVPKICQLWQELQTSMAPTMREYSLTEADINQQFKILIEGLLEKYRVQSGKHRLAEKTPNNAFFFLHLHHIFPNSPFIHMIRDGRDVVSSLLTMDWLYNGQPWDLTQSAQKAAEYWAAIVSSGRSFRNLNDCHQYYFELRYEDLVTQPQDSLQQVFMFLDEPWEAAVLNYDQQQHHLPEESSTEQVSKSLYHTSIGRWQQDLSEPDREIVKEVAGELLIELGYAQDFDW